MKGKKMTHKEKVGKLEADKNYRRSICKALCDHLSNGYSFESFTELSITSLKRCMNLYPEDFNGEEIEHSMQKGRDAWETIGKRQATGDCMGNSRSWWLNMVHRYKWSDRLDIKAEHSGTVAVNIVDYASKKGCKSTLEQG